VFKWCFWQAIGCPVKFRPNFCCESTNSIIYFYQRLSEFLFNAKHKCMEQTKNLKTDCSQAWHLNSNFYYGVYGLLKVIYHDEIMK